MPYILAFSFSKVGLGVRTRNRNIEIGNYENGRMGKWEIMQGNGNSGILIHF